MYSIRKHLPVETVLDWCIHTWSLQHSCWLSCYHVQTLPRCGKEKIDNKSHFCSRFLSFLKVQELGRSKEEHSMTLFLGVSGLELVFGGGTAICSGLDLKAADIA